MKMRLVVEEEEEEEEEEVSDSFSLVAVNFSADQPASVDVIYIFLMNNKQNLITFRVYYTLLYTHTFCTIRFSH